MTNLIKKAANIYLWHKTGNTIKELGSSGYSGREGAFLLVKEGKHDKAKLLLQDRYGAFSLKNMLDDGDTLGSDLADAVLVGITYYYDSISRVKEAATEHSRILRRKFNQLVNYDDYGITDSSLWDKERTYFVKTVAKVDIENDTEAKLLEDNEKINLSLEIERTILEAIQDEFEAHDSNFNGSGSLEYEHWCASILSANGWSCRTTRATGDQGADILAEKEGIKIAVQCKLYNSPVGNKAVQEVAASRAYYEADYAIVVTNADYTKSAKSLSASTDVILIHHSDLGNIWTMIYKP